MTDLVPQPVTISTQPGSWTLSDATGIVADAAAEPAAQLLRELVGPATGLALPTVTGGSAGAITFRAEPTLADEEYHLQVRPDGVQIAAADIRGHRHAVQTLQQLLPAEVFSSDQVDGVKWEVPCVEIQDKPRFAWRGAMLDVGRHFFPTEFLHRFVDLLAMHRLNKLHLHLTDDQGWRIEIEKYPRLTEVGAWRTESMAGHYKEQRFDGQPHGGFYTKAELRGLVEYAAARGIDIVPEIDLPGHMRAAIAAYPELGNHPEKTLPVATTWGVHPEVLNVEDSTIEFCKDVLTELMEVFPSPLIHIGGDECPKDEWNSSPAAQAKMAELGVDADGLQSWFIGQLSSFLTEKGRRLIGWDEILEGGLASGATVMSWRSEEGGIEAASAGHDVVMCPHLWTYFDYYQADPESEPVAIGRLTPLRTVYEYEPVPAELGPEAAAHVLGTQGQLWTEYMPTSEHVEYMAFPRLCALAEVAWGTTGEYDDFRARLVAHLTRLDQQDVHYRRLDANT
ncbi:beta-N-acetylhexosaminidase [Luteipulveratus mongoliensis]|uniref:beta-N-acetylhexosaminidase n=1 Tax=Luteipulveratus mongoliensis TaxID=571913 RepID=A0A0K1JK66_9MICO|nr:beta-N-acetylhexosaminidase [Luteipulveratus mongoliensis]AKU17112.1 hypothetical protein VV02_16670 [Luteipulveratus mongoliensis]